MKNDRNGYALSTDSDAATAALDRLSLIHI